jgi:hypothetical protein
MAIQAIVSTATGWILVADEVLVLWLAEGELDAAGEATLLDAAAVVAAATTLLAVLDATGKADDDAGTAAQIPCTLADWILASEE